MGYPEIRLRLCWRIEGHLWVGVDDGLYIYENRHFVPFVALIVSCGMVGGD
jgi:hypothetical protein